MKIAKIKKNYKIICNFPVATPTSIDDPMFVFTPCGKTGNVKCVNSMCFGHCQILQTNTPHDCKVHCKGASPFPITFTKKASCDHHLQHTQIHPQSTQTLAPHQPHLPHKTSTLPHPLQLSLQTQHISLSTLNHPFHNFPNISSQIPTSLKHLLRRLPPSTHVLKHSQTLFPQHKTPLHHLSPLKATLHSHKPFSINPPLTFHTPFITHPSSPQNHYPQQRTRQRSLVHRTGLTYLLSSVRPHG
jgi:hypothetical protein